MAEEQGRSAGPGSEDATRVATLSGDEQGSTAETAAATAALPKVGHELGPVRLVCELGHGAMGVVFLGRHLELNRDVAVKVLTVAAPGPRRLALGRFAEEASAAAAVQDPGLARVYGADVSGPVPYLIMEYVDGPTLARLLASCGRLPAQVALLAMADVARAVARLHESGIVHRDLKPGNILLDREARVVVSDLGVAVTLEAAGPESAGSLRLAGTPAYMAPEMFEGRVSPRTDVYAMGVMLAQLVSGKIPVEGTTALLRESHSYMSVQLDAVLGAGVDGEVMGIIRTATAPQSAVRFATSAGFGEAVAALLLDADNARRELRRLIAASEAEPKPRAG